MVQVATSVRTMTSQCHLASFCRTANGLPSYRQAKGETRCSRYTEAHDQPGGANEPVPEPDELAKNIGELENWVSEMRGKRKRN